MCWIVPSATDIKAIPATFKSPSSYISYFLVVLHTEIRDEILQKAVASEYDEIKSEMLPPKLSDGSIARNELIHIKMESLVHEYEVALHKLL